MGKLRNSTTPGVSTLAKDVVKRWKEVIESKKSKRKRAEDGEEVKKEDGGAVKKVKTEGGSASFHIISDYLQDLGRACQCGNTD